MRKTFFIFTQISLPKNGGKKRVKQFFQKHKNSAIKKCSKKIAGKCAKNVSLYSYDYRDQNWGGKTRETIFPETH